MPGFCKNIDVEILPDNSIRVSDDGRGIPVDMHEKEGRPALEVVRPYCMAGESSTKVPIKCRAVSTEWGFPVSMPCRLTCRSTYRQGKHYVQEYECGHLSHTVKEVGDAEGKRGTTVTFSPDKTIFTATVYDYNTLPNDCGNWHTSTKVFPCPSKTIEA